MTARTIYIDESLPDRVRAIMEFLLKAAIEAIGADGSSVMLLSPGGDILTMVGMAAREAGSPRTSGSPSGRGAGLRQGGADGEDGDHQRRRAAEPRFLGCEEVPGDQIGDVIPLRLNGRILGVLNLKRIMMDAPLNPTEARIAEALASVAAGLLA